MQLIDIGLLSMWVGCKESLLGWVARTGYTLSMDSVRFGRALGIGARLAAKTVASAVDAATAPNPSAQRPAEAAAKTASAARVPLVEKAAQATAQVKQTQEGLKRGSKRFGEAVWNPFVRLSGVLWLELTGVFFGLFAFSAGVGAWKLRGAANGTATNHNTHVQFLIATGVAVVFGYFCVSSFVRARRRERNR